MGTRNIKPTMDMSILDIETNIILEIISSKTRRKILSILSEEPMYFNQLAKKIDIGQQSILRHMVILEKSGLIETYEERSNLGGPNRKYYKVKSSFNINVSLSKDSFSLVNKEIEEIGYKDTLTFYKDFESKTKDDANNALIYLREIFLDIEDQINDLEERTNHLRAMKQRVLSKLQTVCEGIKLDSLERNIIYGIIKRSPKNFEELVHIMDIDGRDVNTAVTSIYQKLEGSRRKNFLRKYACLQT
jgi:ArsR family transcriptional regulator